MSKKIIGIASITSLLVVGLLLRANIIRLPITINTEASWAYNFGDNRILVGSSHNVFAAKVNKKLGQKNIDGFPVTSYEVQIVTNIKGDFTGTIVLDQAGGYENGILRLFEGGRLIDVGSTYILATRTQEDGSYFLSSYLAGKMKISENSSMTLDDLKTLALTNADFLRFSDAYKNEINPEKIPQ